MRVRLVLTALLLALAGCKHLPINGGPPTSLVPMNARGTVFLASGGAYGYGTLVHKTYP